MMVVGFVRRMVEAGQASWIYRGGSWWFKLLAFSSEAAFFSCGRLKNLCYPDDRFYVYEL